MMLLAQNGAGFSGRPMAPISPLVRKQSATVFTSISL